MFSYLDKIRKLNNNWKYENVICILFVVAGIIGWQFNYIISAISVLMLTAFLLVVHNDNKYIIPGGLILLFSYNNGFVAEEIPFDIIIPVALYAILVIIFAIKNFKLKSFKKNKSYIGFSIMAVCCFVPIFWNDTITSENSILYVMYFSWFLYLVGYLVISLTLGDNSFRMLIFSFSWLAMLLSYECIITPLTIYFEDPSQNILSIIFQLGWGVCNEGGIMLCFLIPFIMYELLKSRSTVFMCISHLKLIIVLVGILLTNSRGSILFCVLEYVSLMVLVIIFSKEKLFNISLLVFFTTILCVGFNLKFGFAKFFDDMDHIVFLNDFISTGRTEVWSMARAQWDKSIITRIFGSGIVSEFQVMRSYRGEANIYVVYHSTYYEMLVVGGIIGVVGMFIHFIEKYRILIPKDFPFLFVMLAGFAIIDFYGMIDNTYGMYYFMVPLIILISVVEKNDNLELFDKYKLESISY